MTCLCAVCATVGTRIPSGETVYTCFSSDFLLSDADPWRPEAWAMMRRRSDLHFLFITKRIERLAALLPPDWGEGYFSRYTLLHGRESGTGRLSPALLSGRSAGLSHHRV